MYLLVVGAGSVGQVQWTQLFGGGAQDTVRKRELDVFLVELSHAEPLAFGGGNSGSADDLK